ncbi:hypothetical protein BJ138DRAFT_1130574, partial [Hygrophoropsis aurantiaca]
MQSTVGKIEFSLTVVGATGLSQFDDNYAKGFYVMVEVDGKQARTTELAPSPQSTVEWNSCFPLKVDKASHLLLCLYECRTTVRHLRGANVIWETRVTVEQLLGCDTKFTCA